MKAGGFRLTLKVGMMFGTRLGLTDLSASHGLACTHPAPMTLFSHPQLKGYFHMGSNNISVA